MSKSSQEIKTIVERLNPQARRILGKMESGLVCYPAQLQELLGEGTKAKAVGAVGWLISHGLAQEAADKIKEEYVVSLADKGEYYVKAGGMPEGRIIEFLKSEKISTISDLSEKLSMPKEELNPILGTMKKEKVVNFAAGGRVDLGEDKAIEEALARYDKINNLLNEVEAKQRVDLKKLSLEEQRVIEEMSRKRGKGKAVFRVAREVEMAYELTDDGVLAREICRDVNGTEMVGALTPEMLEKGLWKNKVFRKYDLKTPPLEKGYGRKHPYGLFLDVVRKKLAAMGFEEMKGRMVETEFWNNDALFMPQGHPARDIHDVYFVKEPKFSKELPEGLVEKVAQTHEYGWDTGSSGWGYKFNRKKTSRLVLRSQGTAVSARMLASNPKVPGKYFAITRCFRYDQVDVTHASDFNQIEGIVVSPSINFCHLLGLLKLFALEIAGSREIKFVPSYFPFTEPSVEVHCKHEKLGWIELGGAGIFRKEVTMPFGIDVPVIAWGLGLDRMAMVALSVDDIRDLFTSDLGKLKKMKFRTTDFRI